VELCLAANLLLLPIVDSSLPNIVYLALCTSSMFTGYIGLTCVGPMSDSSGSICASYKHSPSCGGVLFPCCLSASTSHNPTLRVPALYGWLRFRCGSSVSERPCAEGVWSCGVVCGAVLGCGRHKCEKVRREITRVPLHDRHVSGSQVFPASKHSFPPSLQ
jgi:hypothetical protein